MTVCIFTFFHAKIHTILLYSITHLTRSVLDSFTLSCNPNFVLMLKVTAHHTAPSLCLALPYYTVPPHMWTHLEASVTWMLTKRQCLPLSLTHTPTSFTEATVFEQYSKDLQPHCLNAIDHSLHVIRYITHWYKSSANIMQTTLMRLITDVKKGKQEQLKHVSGILFWSKSAEGSETYMSMYWHEPGNKQHTNCSARGTWITARKFVLTV